MFPSRYFADRFWAPRYWVKTGTAETPTAISTDHIVAMFTYPRALGDDIIYQDATGALIVNRGYGPPAPITPSSTLIVGLYTFHGISEQIVQQDGAGVVKVRKGLS